MTKDTRNSSTNYTFSRNSAGAVISNQPGPKVGLPSNGGTGALALSPSLSRLTTLALVHCFFERSLDGFGSQCVSRVAVMTESSDGCTRVGRGPVSARAGRRRFRDDGADGAIEVGARRSSMGG